MPDFELHPRLAADTIEVGELELCKLLLMNDAHYPWLVLVPRRAGVREIFQLARADQHLLLAESSMLAERMQLHFAAHKMNLAALGNLVPQLHIHLIARHTHDLAWPAPVFGLHPAQPYTDDELQKLRTILQEWIRECASRQSVM
ncbi:MAG: HIT domain-containing protein [Pseudomonadota bacterium]